MLGNTAFALARLARVFNRGALPVTGWAGRSDAKEALLTDDLALAMARWARNGRRAFFCTSAFALAARSICIEFDVSLKSVQYILE
jgi:hypothetical protein